jgi:hypothetical protein
MAVEVALPIRGEVRLRDARAVHGHAFNGLDYVDVLVLDIEGRSPVVGRIELVDVPGGRGMRRGFVCPRCHESTRLLVARAGELRCRICDRRRSRRQLERTRADWRRRGGCEEDQLLRLLSRPKLTTGGLDQAREVARQILDDDRLRLQGLMANIEVIECSIALRT